MSCEEVGTNYVLLRIHSAHLPATYVGSMGKAVWLAALDSGLRAVAVSCHPVGFGCKEREKEGVGLPVICLHHTWTH
jgi:hypothetical protein